MTDLRAAAERLRQWNSDGMYSGGFAQHVADLQALAEYALSLLDSDLASNPESLVAEGFIIRVHGPQWFASKHVGGLTIQVYESGVFVLGDGIAWTKLPLMPTLGAVRALLAALEPPTPAAGGGT